MKWSRNPPRSIKSGDIFLTRLKEGPGYEIVPVLVDRYGSREGLLIVWFPGSECACNVGEVEEWGPRLFRKGDENEVSE